MSEDRRPKCTKCKDTGTDHRTGLCSKCRSTGCSVCKREFVPSVEGKPRCHQCEANLKERINTHANYFNSGGV